MKNINLFLFAFLLILTACDYDQEQMFDKEKDPVAPVLTVEGATTFVVTEELPDFFYSVLTWSRANFGKDIPANYILQVSDGEDFSGTIKTVVLGTDVYLRALSAAELYSWAVDDFGVNNDESGQKDPATLFFRIVAERTIPGSTAFTVTSNVESMLSKRDEGEEWEPVELTIRFKVVSGDWGEYAVYAWGESEVYGSWPGTTLAANSEGWYSITVPVNRPINLIINDNGNGKQFDFLKDPTVNLCYEFEIAADNSCTMTEVECPSDAAALYMIGDDFGSWDWSSGGVVEMTPVNGYEGHFWAVRYIAAGKGFKWCTKREWDGDFNSLGEVIGYTVSDGNAYVAESGMYMIYVDMENGRISIEPAKVYGIGDCFGSWDITTYPFTVENQVMTCTTTGNGELRIYAASDIAPVGNDWWRMEFVILDGKIAYRGNGGDQARTSVEAGKKVVLDFNSGTGTF
ncbi:MAG: SusF/SusE family outer membrane protein [Tannerella sp.]|jgi:hypothetical protein|nr:SusF/SusE family outer membrane protein [Tannerella sp.]